MKHQLSYGHLAFFIVLLFFLLILIQLELLAFAFAKLNLPPMLGFMILVLSLLGSAINIPVFRMRSDEPPQQMLVPLRWGLFKIPLQPFSHETEVSVNLGGCLIPLVLSVYLFVNSDLSPVVTLFGITIMTAISYIFSRPIPGFGIAMPILIAPVSAALVALLLYPEQSAPLAYISGTMGVLIGADLLHLKAIPKLGSPQASIGGAGTFDGIFITGIVAALLA